MAKILAKSGLNVFPLKGEYTIVDLSSSYKSQTIVNNINYVLKTGVNF